MNERNNLEPDTSNGMMHARGRDFFKLASLGARPVQHQLAIASRRSSGAAAAARSPQASGGMGGQKSTMWGRDCGPRARAVLINMLGSATFSPDPPESCTSRCGRTAKRPQPLTSAHNPVLVAPSRTRTFQAISLCTEPPFLHPRPP